ncbi:FG-GAP-like repeat-containing protein [Micromonospora sp. DT43]|uniref:FG-GAP-like repeat-containing protein n=1 Tax=Micromonospora sp. DT43 TaxID=3393440 RepID=UPI003CEC6CCA
MPTIKDVSPTRSNTPNRKSGQFTTGRMLSLDSSDDGQLVFAGSFSSNLWVSEDGGESWSQVDRPQPSAGQFGVPGAMGGYCVTSIAVAPDSARWAVERNPRLLGEISGDPGAGIVGFGDTGLWTATSRSDGTFAAPRLLSADFGTQAGGWQVDRHPRFVADLTGDGRADIVGFGDAGVWVALNNGDGTFGQARFVLADLGYESGWRVEKHVRVLADLTGDGCADIVAFGDDGVYVALNRGDGTFAFTPVPAIPDFGFDAGGWRVEKHVRVLADLTGDGCADVVAFGDDGVWVALNNGDGTFAGPRFVLADLGYESGWRVEKHVRTLANLTDGRGADIVAFGNAGVYVALGQGDGTFTFTPTPALAEFGHNAGGWRIPRHPRLVGDVTSAGHADIVGFGNAGVHLARNNGDGTFQPSQLVVRDFGYDSGWRVEKHPRFLVDVTGDGHADIVGFGEAGVYVSRASGTSFEPPRLVLPNFGAGAVVLALAQCDRESQDAGVWRSSDRGANWTRVHGFPRSTGQARLPGAGQLVWAPGTANLVYAAGGSSLAVSTDGGATFTDVMPRPGGGFQQVNHVAVAATPPGALQPPIVYALASRKVFVSADAGLTWVPDVGPVPATIGGATGLANAPNERVMVVSPRSPLEVFATADANLVPPELWRGDYTQFTQTNASRWTPMPLPDLVNQKQFSGNVFVAATQPGHGEVLFYGPQRAKVFAAPLDPASAADWHELDDGQHAHVDLHGIFLSPDFAATVQDGSYVSTSGTVWMASDGGIFRSTDGGRNFHAAGSISTLSVVNIAGVANPGRGPVISLNTGDNDGFASADGGQTWRPQDYGGGDNDCSFADPLRPSSMLVFTPRWNTDGQFATGGTGQTLAVYGAPPGELPDVTSRTRRQMIPGPSLRPGSTIWNATSGFVIRGYRPIVHDLPGDAPQPDDQVFIRFFGNFSSRELGTFPNNLAVLLRVRNLRAVTKRTDWDTPGGWRVDRHLRLLADVTGDGHADVVGFGDAGVWTALSTSRGSFADPRLVLADLGYESGWRVEKHPRLLADLTNSGGADIVAFGNAGVYVALSNSDGTFSFTPVPVVTDFGHDAGSWRVEKHLRFAVDLTGDGCADIVGFGDDGVSVALNNGDGTFGAVQFVLADLGYESGWRVEKHVRVLADLTGDGCADIVAFGDDGVYVALNRGDGTFAFTPVPAIPDFGFDAGGWRVEKHVRVLADLTGDGCADVVAFGDDGVWVALNNGDGTFAGPRFVLADLGYDSGWRVEKHVRTLANLTDGRGADIVAFGNAGVYTALGNGDGTFAFTPVPAVPDFGYDSDWRVEQHPRFVADVTSAGHADIVGFGDAGVLIAVNRGDGTFPPRPLFVIPNFGAGEGGPFEQQGPFLPDPNVGIVQAAGGHSGTVFVVGGDDARRLWKWTDGMPAWQQLVPGGGAGQARRFFVDPYRPNLLYLLDREHVMRSDDGGVTWRVDASLEQMLTCGGRIGADRDEDADGQGDHYGSILSDMQFDPVNPRRRFAVGLAGAFMTTDGVVWTRLLDTGAVRGRPANCYFDCVSNPADPALYVSFAGRSIMRISGFAVTGPVAATSATPAVFEDHPPASSDLRRSLVRTRDGQVGTAQAMPDDRVLVTFDDGRSIVVDADEITPHDDRL